MENKKSTVLLTVIAVATLLVAVVGATFAYFTAQGGETTSTNVSVTTGTPSSSTFTANALTLQVDAQEFVQDAGNKSSTATGSARFTGSSDGSSSEVCYTVTLNITANNFVYSEENATSEPELVITVNKGGTVATASSTTGYIDGSTYITGGTDLLVLDVTDSATYTAGTSYQVPTTLNGAEYIHKITNATTTEVTDSWIYEADFVNLDLDQNFNTGKAFTGTIVFAPAACS